MFLFSSGYNIVKFNSEPLLAIFYKHGVVDRETQLVGKTRNHLACRLASRLNPFRFSCIQKQFIILRTFNY